MRLNTRIVYRCFFLTALILTGCEGKREAWVEGQGSPHPEIHTLNGATMGTTYSVRYVQSPECDWTKETIQQQIDAKLAEISRMANPYRQDSEISRFNQFKSKRPFPVSVAFAALVQSALEMARDTKGAYDPTLMPIVRMFGFGPDPSPVPPDPQSIEAAKQYTGFEKLSVDPSGFLIKSHPDLELDLSGMAKGFGVDQIHELLLQAGCAAWVVEIGGEIRSFGCKPDGTPWRIGIETPSRESLFRENLHAVIGLENAALATSGDYRNFRQSQGQYRHHIIDPETGLNPRHQLASVSILHKCCAHADAFATAAMVLGPDQGKKLVTTCPEMEAYFILREENGAWSTWMTEGFPVLEGEQRN